AVLGHGACAAGYHERGKAHGPRLVQRVLTWLEERSRWSKLRVLGQSSLVRASVLTPVFGYLLLLNDNVRQFLTVQFDAGGLFHYLPSMWRVWMLYYGSFSLAIGSILFGWRCPANNTRLPFRWQTASAPIAQPNTKPNICVKN